MGDYEGGTQGKDWREAAKRGRKNRREVAKRELERDVRELGEAIEDREDI